MSNSDAENAEPSARSSDEPDPITRSHSGLESALDVSRYRTGRMREGSSLSRWNAAELGPVPSNNLLLSIHMAAGGTSFFRRYRFLVSRRWILLILAVASAVTACSLLAQWQLGKNADRSSENTRIERAMQAEPRPVGDVLTVGEPVAERDEWQPVRARGHYVDDQLLVRYRDHQGKQGLHVLAPLRTEDGDILVVNRGWIAGNPTDPPDPPRLPDGEVTVTGRVRISESGDVDPGSGQLRFIDVPEIASWLDEPTYGGYIELTEQRPAVTADAPTPVEAPELDPGPFLSYGIQWYIFGVIAVGGLGILAHDEAHGGRLQRRWKIKG